MTNSNHNDLGAAFTRRPDCLAIDELERVLEGGRGNAAKLEAEAHVAECSHCRTELALLKEFESPTIRPEERPNVNWIVARLRKNSPAKPIAWWTRIWNIRILAPASLAIAAALVVIGIGLQSRHTPVEPAFTPGREVMRSQSIDVISPVGDLAKQPAELQWHAVPGASEYRVRVLEVDRTELWNTTVSQTIVALNDTLRQKIVPRKTLMWEVSALNSSGAVVANSGIQEFRLQPGASH